MNIFARLLMHLLSVETIMEFVCLHVLWVSLCPVSARLYCSVCVCVCFAVLSCWAVLSRVRGCVGVCFV